MLNSGAHVAAAPGTNQTFVNTYSPLLPACDPTNYLEYAQLPPEKFWNCADITIRQASAVNMLSSWDPIKALCCVTSARPFSA
jgi:hypothetical protein